MQDARRVDLIELVRLAKMTPAEAERIAELQGLVRLPDGLNPVEWDPATKPIWTLLMSLAWALRQDFDLVRQSWDAYANAGAQCWRHIAGSDGWELRPIAKPTLVTLFLQTVDNDQFDRRNKGETAFLSIEATATRLVDQLAFGQVKAFGSRKRGEHMRLIEPHEWPMLAPYEDGTSVVHRGTGDFAFHHVHVDQGSLFTCFPPSGIPKNGTKVERNHLHEAIVRTIAEVYPNGIPAFRNQTQRNETIWKAGIEKGLIVSKHTQVPSDKTFSRIFAHMKAADKSN